jgi:hypothetical protein
MHTMISVVVHWFAELYGQNVISSIPKIWIRGEFWINHKCFCKKEDILLLNMLFPLDICAWWVFRIVWNYVFVIVLILWLFHVSRTHHVICFNRKDPKYSPLMEGCSSWVNRVELKNYAGYSHPWLIHYYHGNKNWNFIFWGQFFIYFKYFSTSVRGV